MAEREQERGQLGQCFLLTGVNSLAPSWVLDTAFRIPSSLNRTMVFCDAEFLHRILGINGGALTM